MISEHDNRRLTQVGPDTPMGRLMRRYWLPVCASSQVPTPDCDPLRTRMLGENYIVFRNTDGVVGVLDENCMHRRASLAIGRVEDNGIRCLYHGWKFGVDGTIQETPNHCDERFRQRLKAPAYPCREAGGLIWAYFGPKNQEPPFQQYEFFQGPEENRCIFRINIPCNYLQLFEGGTDSSHVGILHCNMANPEWKDRASFVPDLDDYTSVAMASGDNAPELEIENTPYGYHYAAKREGPQVDGLPTHSVRATAVIMPVLRIIPLREYQFFVFEVPQDDHKTSTYIVCHGPKPFDREKMKVVLGLTDERYWRETDVEYRATPENLWFQDRSRINETWSGMTGLIPEDSSISVSMGPVVERPKEVLVAADAAVVRLRERLLDAIRLHEEKGEALGVSFPDLSRVRSLADTNVPVGKRWFDSAVFGTARRGVVGINGAGIGVTAHTDSPLG
jgi:phthalate 4,5-dioxygenase oxygenase subunit